MALKEAMDKKTAAAARAAAKKGEAWLQCVCVDMWETLAPGRSKMMVLPEGSECMVQCFVGVHCVWHVGVGGCVQCGQVIQSLWLLTMTNMMPSPICLGQYRSWWLGPACMKPCKEVSMCIVQCKRLEWHCVSTA